MCVFFIKYVIYALKRVDGKGTSYPSALGVPCILTNMLTL